MTTRQTEPALARRELATRRRSSARAAAAALARLGVTPNQVSVCSLVFAGVAGAALVASPEATGSTRAAWLALAALGIQGRLLCNLLDGMLAVEQGLKTRTGDIFNELPDRLADVVILVCAGYGARHVEYGIALGWLSAVLAVLTAYVRVLAGSLGLPQRFLGPMAKQHRMFVLTLAVAAGAGEALWMRPSLALPAGLAAIAGGSVITLGRRVHALFRDAGAR
ncbi:MAG TPA: CDP-alcohol phosphatidyltransferase family protein [Vicinamibacterales bacterium]|nr:CDP-alcohol phosphatidyltransferase family protein [Vicinamibacterales bacterium]